MKAQWNADGGRILLGDNTAVGSGDAVADQVPVWWSLDLFALTFVCVCVYLAIYVLNSDLRRTLRNVSTA